MREIVEVKHTLGGERKEFACQLLEEAPGEAILLYELAQAVSLRGLHLPAGTRTVAYYWEDRPYNLYHWIHPEGTTLAYYFNIATGTRIWGDRVEWHDLGVDLLVAPGQSARFLDEDELPEDLDARLWGVIWRAKAELLKEHPRIIEEIGPRSRRMLNEI